LQLGLTLIDIELSMNASALGFNPLYSDDNPSLDEISSLDGYACIEFGAPWCEHCVAAEPAIEAALSATQIPHIKVYDGKGLPLGRAFKITLWPTVVLLKDGKEVARVVRPTIVEQLNKLLANIAA